MNKPEVIETKYSVRDGGHYVPGIKYNGVFVHIRSIVD